MVSIDAIVNRQLMRWQLEREQAEQRQSAMSAPCQVITVSRQIGSRGTYLARLLAEALDYHWLHSEVIDAICASSGYRKRVIEALDRRFRSDLEVLVEALLTGQAVDHTDYNRHLFEVVLSMGRLGGVVLVGRGGCFILGPLRGFHIRVIAPKRQRIANLIKHRGFTDEQARQEIARNDAQRAQMINKLFGANIDDPQYYDVVINSAAYSPEELVPPVVAMARTKLARISETV